MTLAANARHVADRVVAAGEPASSSATAWAAS